MAERIDRLYMMSNSGKRKLRTMRYRYLSKSILASCKGDVELYMEHESDIDQVMEIVEQSYKLQADE